MNVIAARLGVSLVCVCALIALPLKLSALVGQTVGARPNRTVWDGVYSVAQAARGKAAYGIYCTSCHGEALTGADGPSLTGESFQRNWFEDSVSSLYAKLRTSMPGDAPGTLGAGMYIDIVGYLLQANGFPAGKEELVPIPEVIAGIRIEGKNGPAPVPNFALVEVAGCLARSPDKTWMLTRASEPGRTRDLNIPDTDMLDPTSVTLGIRTFSLTGPVSLPDTSQGARSKAKGFLIRTVDDEAELNVTSLRTFAARCDP